MKIFLFIFALFQIGYADESPLRLSTDKVALRALDKVSGKVQTLEVAKGNPTYFGNLQIELKVCRKAPPEEHPESLAYLVIRETRKGETFVVFDGWMFASAPDVSAMEHPVYDVWVHECIGETLETLPATPIITEQANSDTAKTQPSPSTTDSRLSSFYKGMAEIPLEDAPGSIEPEKDPETGAAE